jgi:serine/threonine-protein kinase
MADETILNGRYLLTAQRGSGGMSVIYQATDRALGRKVAIKVLRPSLTKDPSFLEKFRNEARAVANLSHPNIVTVHDVGSDGAAHYIVMELVDGQDLKKIIKAHGALPIDRVLNLAIEICDGIGYAHRSGLVHADVKPQNILVTSEDVVKVTDFGIAQALSDTQPQQKRAEVVWGSPHYFSPEQARGEQPSPASDVYSIGIVLFEMLTGQLPYSGANQRDLAMAHLKDPVPRVTDPNPSVPESLSNIVYKVMSKDRSARYREADQLGNILQNFRDRATDHTAVHPQVPASQRPPRPPESKPQQNAEATEKYSAAPNAPNPYDPRRPYQPPQDEPSVPSPGRPVTQQPQPLEQRYSVPRNQNQGQPRQQSQTPSPQAYGQSDSQYYRAQYSQPMRVEPEEEGTDWITIILAFLALMAVGGLVPLWIAVFTVG